MSRGGGNAPGLGACRRLPAPRRDTSGGGRAFQEKAGPLLEISDRLWRFCSFLTQPLVLMWLVVLGRTDAVGAVSFASITQAFQFGLQVSSLQSLLARERHRPEGWVRSVRRSCGLHQVKTSRCISTAHQNVRDDLSRRFSIERIIPVACSLPDLRSSLCLVRGSTEPSLTRS